MDFKSDSPARRFMQSRKLATWYLRSDETQQCYWTEQSTWLLHAND